MRTVEEQVEIIRTAGFRVTQSRLAVLTVLAEAEGFLDPAAIHRLGRRFHPRLGRVSVYRALDLLSELGLVRQVHCHGNCQCYARAVQPKGHYLICQRCGHITEFACTGLDGMAEALGRQHDFDIQGHWLQLEGLCHDCR